MTVELYLGNCLDIMPTLTEPFNAIIADLPYGTTACKWDTVIPFKPLWEQYKRLIKPKGAIVLFGSQPFTSALVMSNPGWFKYEWVWNKRLAGNGILAKIQPLKIHESVLVFSEGACAYFPQMSKGRARWKGGIKDKHGTFSYAKSEKVWNDEYYPISIIDASGAGMRQTREHPTQKPIALLEYLIRTYTNEGETVLDNVMGSGSTGVACVNTERNFAGIELLPEYYAIAQERIEKAQNEMQQLDLPGL